MPPLPPIFVERLKRILPEESFAEFVKTDLTATVAVRINTLKTTREAVLTQLKERDIAVDIIPWADDAIILKNKEQRAALEGEFNKGFLYQQNLSSMLVVKILHPQPLERVLDLCAAPGSKTSYMAAMMQNKGEIIAVEPIKNRFYRLKAVLQTLGVENTTIKFVDGRKFRDSQLFNRILVDAPCSAEARFSVNDAKTFGYWSPRKIKEMAHKQRGLLLNAYRLLKPGGMLVYSTCTFAPEENEGTIDWFLRKADADAELEAIDFSAIEAYPALAAWEKKNFNPEIKKCLRILPTELMDGFFIAKIRKQS